MKAALAQHEGAHFNPTPRGTGRGRARHSSESEVSQGYMLRPGLKKKDRRIPLRWQGQEIREMSLNRKSQGRCHEMQMLIWGMSP